MQQIEILLMNVNHKIQHVSTTFELGPAFRECFDALDD